VALTLALCGCGLSNTSNIPDVADPLPALPQWSQALVGKPLVPSFATTSSCAGYVDIVTAKYGKGLTGAAIEGWGWDAGAKKPALQVLLVDDTGKIVGAADGGRPRPDVPKARPDVPNPNVGWRGYTTAVKGEIKAYAVGDSQSACLLGRIDL
jgi:hypothetical protein